MSDQGAHAITIDRIENGVVWMAFTVEGKAHYRVPLAQCLREYLEPEWQQDKDRDDGWNTEVAFKKMAVGKALESELDRA